MNNKMTRQHTLNKAVSFVGLGLHSGINSRITLKPSDTAAGIFFKRKDVPESCSLIVARWYKITDTTLSTVLTNQHGVSVSTVEHLLAALRLCRIDCLEIEVDGPEIPIMDGSAAPFVEVLKNVGTRPISADKKAIWVHTTVKVQDQDGDRYALFSPDTQPKISVAIDFKEAVIGAQTLSVNINDDSLQQSIAPARTFGFADQVEALHKQGLALGGSLNNAILVDNDRVLNKEGLRFDNEFVRHKVLDAIGDISLAGVPILGHYQSYKGGHLMNKRLLSKLIRNKFAWSFISMDEFYQLHDTDQLITKNTMDNSEEKSILLRYYS